MGRAHELCESRGGRPGLPVPNSPRVLCGRKATFKKNAKTSELRSCLKVELDVLGLIVPNSPYGLCGRKATLNSNWSNRAQELCESRDRRPGRL